MKFATGVHLYNTRVDPEHQGYRSKVKVDRFKKRDLEVCKMNQNHVQPVLEACQHSWQLKLYDVSIMQYTEMTSWLLDNHHSLQETLY